MTAIIMGLRPATRIEWGFREVKMLRPVCDICTDGPNVPKNWYETCPHDPYIGTRVDTTTERQYETQDDGTRVITGTNETQIERPFPNFVGVSATTIVNSGLGVEKGRAKGFILPSEYQGPAYPEGIADCCEFRDCFVQTGLKDYRSGRFCREGEAIAAYRAEYSREAVEIHDAEIRREQIDRVRQRVKV